MSRTRFRAVFVLVMVLYVCLYGLYVTRFPKILVNPDLPVYSTVLLQTEDPTLFSQDPTYGDGRLTNTFWSSGYLYMRVFQGLYAITGRAMSPTLALLQLIPGLVAVLTFYGLLSAFHKDRWLTLGLSVSLSVWLVLGYNEGIPTLYYLALTPAFLRLLWTSLFEPSLAHQPVVYWHVIFVGMIIALSSLLLNSVSALGFSVFALGCATLLLLAGHMTWRSYAALLLGIVPLLGLISLGGVGSVNTKLDTDTALHFINGEFVATVLTRGQFLVGALMRLFNTPFSLVFYLPVTGLLAFVALWIRRSRRPSKEAKFLYIALSWVLGSSLLGNIGIVLSLYFAARVLAKRDEKLDAVLVTGINVGQLIGPVLMWIVVGLWSITQWHTLALILFQMFRFSYFAFFVVTVALLFIIDDLTESIPNRSARSLLQLTLMILIPIQIQLFPVPALSLYVLVLLVLILIRRRYGTRLLFLTSAMSSAFQIHARQSALIVSFFMLAVVALWSNGLGEMLSKAPGSLPPNPKFLSVSSYNDYVDMTEWLRMNTPQDSFVHFQERWDWGFFRFLSRRSLLFNWMDDTLGPTTSESYARERDIIQSIETTPLVFFGERALHYGVNYLVLYDATLAPLPYQSDRLWYQSRLVYQNATYRIYHFEAIETHRPITLFLETLKTWLTSSVGDKARLSFFAVN